MTDFDGVAPGQRPDLLGKVPGGRQRRVVDQHRQDAQTLPERGRDLVADEILSLVDAPARAIAGRLAEPARTNDRDQHLALADRALDLLGEVVAGSDRFDVHEDRPAGMEQRQPVANAPGGGGAVGPPVADEDAAHGQCPTRQSRRRRRRRTRASRARGGGGRAAFPA